VNSISVALKSGYLSVRTAEGASEKQSSLKARLRNVCHTVMLHGGSYMVPMILRHSAVCTLKKYCVAW